MFNFTPIPEHSRKTLPEESPPNDGGALLRNRDLENLPSIISTDAPTGDDLKEILRLHRGLDSYVAFMRDDRDGRGLRPYNWHSVEDLEGFFPEFLEELSRDGYYSINGFYRAGTRRTQDLRYINAAFADLDHYGIMHHEEAAAQVLKLVREGELPSPSIIGFSGRGTWLFWILRDDKTGGPLRAFTENRARWYNVQVAINGYLRRIAPDLKADPNAIDGARVTRLPGSINSKSESPVKYLIPAGAGLKGFVYSFDEFATAFGVPKVERIKGKTRTGRRIEGNKRGWLAMNQYRLDEFELIEAARGGFSEGCRNSAALILTKTLRALNCSREEAKARVLAMAGRCNPPYSPREAADVVAFIFGSKGLRATNVAIARSLGVTAEETGRLELKHLRPDFKTRPPGNRNERMAARRSDLAAIVLECDKTGEKVPSLRELVKRLQALGHGGNKDTIRKDLAAVDAETGRTQELRDDKERKANSRLPFEVE